MSSALTSGSVVAGFRISRLVGKGAAGAVYLAEGPDGRQVALKVPIVGNVANDNRGPLGEGGGIWVVAATGNRLHAYVTNRNLDNGIVVAEEEPGDTTGNSLKGNSAARNAGHGIDAVTGTIDAGGNRASGNATPPQCVNIVCSK